MILEQKSEFNQHSRRYNVKFWQRGLAHVLQRHRRMFLLNQARFWEDKSLYRFHRIMLSISWIFRCVTIPFSCWCDSFLHFNVVDSIQAQRTYLYNSNYVSVLVARAFINKYLEVCFNAHNVTKLFFGPWADFFKCFPCEGLNRPFAKDFKSLGSVYVCLVLLFVIVRSDPILQNNIPFWHAFTTCARKIVLF